MFLKAIASILISPIFLLSELFNLSTPEVYIAPKEPAVIVKEEPKTSSSTVAKIVTKTATTTKKQTKPATKNIQKPVAVVPPIPLPPPDFETINTNARKTLVNIFCTTKNNDLSPISGTGVIISNDGLILTNAHIGQYFLLKDFKEKDYLKCIGRVGSPAYPKYNLELVYISPNWVKANKTLLKEQNPKGTGEDDFAFLRVTDMVDGSQLPIFTFIEPNINEAINVGEPVLLASYPAGFLGGLSIIKDLNVTSAITNIQDVFTFKDGEIDVISIGGTVVSQKGSSGGPVVDRNTSLIGIITTSSDGTTTSSRGLNAITLAYINRTLQSELGIKLREFLSLDHSQFAKTFANTTGTTLTKLITDELLR
ncbi:MAG: hypothetical protein CEO12_300 [Parcubacteria group bacterium Gr01-1014_46]|nr:MAG: hypothetical protein CEO12_300 [Parcubacteria group bacterium Gr01-1014_46]